MIVSMTWAPAMSYVRALPGVQLLVVRAAELFVVTLLSGEPDQVRLVSSDRVSQFP